MHILSTELYTPSVQKKAAKAVVFTFTGYMTFNDARTLIFRPLIWWDKDASVIISMLFILSVLCGVCG